MDSNGKDLQNTVIKKSETYTKEECLSDCNKIADATGCEFGEWKNGLNACSYFKGDVASGNGNTRFYCWIKQGEIKLWRLNYNIIQYIIMLLFIACSLAAH